MDDADRTTERQEALDNMAQLNVSRLVQEIANGHAGECDKCGNPSTRLMDAAYFKKKGRAAVADEISDGICPPCRDKFRLP